MSPRETFDAAFLRLTRALALLLDEEQADETFRAVSGFPASTYDPAASVLIAETTVHCLPTPAEWLSAIRRVQAAEREREQQERERTWAEHHDHPATFHCYICKDTGWEPRRCVPAALCGRCARRGHPYDHPYVTECACHFGEHRNPVILARRARAVTMRPPSPDEARHVEARLRRGARDWRRAGA